MSFGDRARLRFGDRWTAAVVSPHEREADRMAGQALALRPLARGPAPPGPMAAEGTAGSGGRPLDKHTRSFFESRFGHDFGRVRVHVGGAAARAARGLGAEAFTIGRDVFLKDETAAHLGGDPRLLAHELAHVVQDGESHPFAPAIHGGSPIRASSAAAPGAVHCRIDPNAPRGPNPGDYATTLNDYLHYLDSFKNVPPARRVPFNPYVKPTPDEVLSAMNASPEFRDAVAESYRRIYRHDLIRDIVELSTEEEKDRLLRPFVSGKGDFPEPSKDKAVA